MAKQNRAIKIIVLSIIIQLSSLIAGQGHLSSQLPMHVDFNGQITTTIANQNHLFLYSAALLVMFALIGVFLILMSTAIQSRFNAISLDINTLISRLCKLINNPIKKPVNLIQINRFLIGLFS